MDSTEHGREINRPGITDFPKSFQIGKTVISNPSYEL